ncbi:hypothetical protein LCGC14_1447490 [marine sediment metagenome]|uniref:Uncharacterized protein n=1 Tax=marine sediment metagenome TaxID=412755 RepID=A0A0F9JJI0_9ZZZZ
MSGRPKNGNKYLIYKYHRLGRKWEVVGHNYEAMAADLLQMEGAWNKHDLCTLVFSMHPHIAAAAAIMARHIK